MSKKILLAFGTGAICGFVAAYVVVVMVSDVINEYSDPHTSRAMKFMAGPDLDPRIHNKSEEFHQMEDTTVADKLANEVRILCWIMTSPANHKKKAIHVKATWGKRCNVLLFMSSETDDSLPSVALPVEDSRTYVWKKTKEAFKYIYKNHMDQAEWFLKADDDTYVIVENLRYMLWGHDPSEPVYYGCQFKPYVKQGWSAGYVLSRDALMRFVEQALMNETICSPEDNGSEDVEIHKCLKAVDVKVGESRDFLGRGRFFPFVPEHHLIPGPVDPEFWYSKYIVYESKEGMDCCSDYAASFHFVSPTAMYVLEYLIYHLQPYGISYHAKMPAEVSEGIGTHDEKSREHSSDFT